MSDVRDGDAFASAADRDHPFHGAPSARLAGHLQEAPPIGARVRDALLVKRRKTAKSDVSTLPQNVQRGGERERELRVRARLRPLQHRYGHVYTVRAYHGLPLYVRLGR